MNKKEPIPELKSDRILLIAPKIIQARSYPSTALAYIGTFLKNNGFDVRIVDTNFTGEDYYKVIDEFGSNNIVGISCESKNIEEALAIAKYAKNRKNTVVMGGLHVSLIQEKILENSCVDFGIHGDGEMPLLKLLRALKGKIPFSEVGGLIYRYENGQIVNKKEYIKNLDELSFPDYRLAGISNISDYPIITSRDCPYECIYCTVGSISHGNWRARNPENIINELISAKQRYNIKKFVVMDENFSYDIERVKNICRNLTDNNINLPWIAMEGIRSDKIDKELLELLKTSGCTKIIYGIESADKDVFAKLYKGEKLETVINAIRIAKDTGFKVGAYFVVGLPGSTLDKEMESIRFVLKHKLDMATFWMAIPYYNTRLYDWVAKNATILRNPTGVNLINSLDTDPFFETPAFSKALVKKAFIRAMLHTGKYLFHNDFEKQPVPFIRRIILICAYIFRYDIYNSPMLIARFFKYILLKKGEFSYYQNH